MLSGIEAQIDAVGLHRHSDEIVRMARPCVQLVREPTEDLLLAVGASKLGGAPDVPPSFRWPVWKDVPLSFIAQLNLGEVAQHLPTSTLPSSGVLAFFYAAAEQPRGFDPQHAGSWRIFYFANDEDLTRREPPTGLPDRAVFPACRAEFSERLSIPPLESSLIGTLSFDEDEAEMYFDLEEALLEHFVDNPLHHVLGYPDPVQGDMQLQCQLVSHGLSWGDGSAFRDPRWEELSLAAPEWNLLLQLDSDETAEMMWGGHGRLYFWIRDQDLARKDFSQVWMVLQST
jgi:uncharacterized protein YwqG